ncbi:MAG: (d)CMP kinase [Phycisphaerales bacterium]|jgi:cytidylate kinase|nr:(d)CMP kinase [Phycisphaerales bacterium]
MQSLQRLVVTIDGAAGTGKSSVAHELAKRLGTECLDTGAMYRAVSVLVVDYGIEADDGIGLATKTKELGITFNWKKSPPSILLGGKDVSSRIRDLDVSSVVSVVASHPEVRDILVDQQREIAEEHPLLVTEGRDQGSIVFPNSPARFFLTANVEERTRRRVKQLREEGKTVDQDQIHKNIMSRDKIDSTREKDPLVCPDGAIVVDTSKLSMVEVVDLLEQSVQSLLAI